MTNKSNTEEEGIKKKIKVGEKAEFLNHVMTNPSPLICWPRVCSDPSLLAC